MSLIDVAEENKVSLEIPAPREAAYNVYTDLVRQPEWSPWLKSIEYDREKQTSKWVVQQNGIRISWSAVSTLEVPGVEVQWMSTTGLKNKGRVTFEDTGPSRCSMTLTLSYNLPFVIAKVLRLEAVERIVQRTLLSDLERFMDVLSREPEVIAATTAVKEGVTHNLSADTGPRQARRVFVDGSGNEDIGRSSGAYTREPPPDEERVKAAAGDGGSETCAALPLAAGGTRQTYASEHDSEGGSYDKLQERSGRVQVVEDDSFDEMPATPLTNIGDRTVDHVESGESEKNLRNSNSISISNSNSNKGEGKGEGLDEQRGFWRKRLRRLRRVFRRDRGMVTPSATASSGKNVDCRGEGRDDHVR